MSAMNGDMKSEKSEDNVRLEAIQKEYKEAIDIFPALHKYQTEHSAVNLQKLCVEIAEFCRAVYVSTRNEEERKIYGSIINVVVKKEHK